VLVVNLLRGIGENHKIGKYKDRTMMREYSVEYPVCFVETYKVTE
jgi:hypothetical protein